MDDILQSIERKLALYGVGKGARVVAAVSGGPDSMALLHALFSLREVLGFRLEAAHYNHNLRESSLRDENIVREYCRALGVVLHVASGDIRAMAAGANIEKTARDARYAFMLGLLEGDDKLAVAHHQSDLAESVLLNIIRGAGTRGMAGMRDVRGSIIRPMLGIPKQDIDMYVSDNGIPYGIDETNMSADYTRNSIRMELIPYIQDKYNPNILAALERLSSNAAEDDDCLTEQAEAALAEMGVTSVGDFFRSFSGCMLCGLHPAVGKRAMRLLLQGMGVYDIDQATINSALEACAHATRVDLGAGVFIKGGEAAELYRLIECDDILSIEGEGEFNSSHWRITAQVVPRPDAFTHGGDWTQHINIRYIDKIPLIARKRAPGDRMRPLNAAGGKKLGDIMTDRKVPLALRDALPVIEHGGELLWAVGTGLADAAKVIDEDNAIKLSFEWNNE